MKMTNYLKQTLLLIFLVTFASPMLYAQANSYLNKEQQEQMNEKRDALKAKLNLSSDQSKKFDEITKQNRMEAKAKLEALPADASKQARREIMQSSALKADGEIMAILTKDQQKIYKEEKETMKKERQEKNKQKKAGKGNFTAG
jgi:hypothetical protein